MCTYLVTKLEETISGYLIFAFVFEIRPILFNFLTLPGSLVGKSPDLNAEPHNFISHTYYLVVTHIPISDNSSILVPQKIYKKCLINLVGMPTAGVSRSIDIKPGYVASGWVVDQ